MIEIKQDMWKIPCNWICIPTNGIYKMDGYTPIAIMGKGAALEAAKKFEDLPYLLGENLRTSGNSVYLLKRFTRDSYVPVAKHYQLNQVAVSIYSFPTKHHWKDKADLELIEKSCEQLQMKYNTVVFQNKNVFFNPPLIPKIVIPRPGCGLGGLDWEKQVKIICEKYFTTDDFIVCHQ